MREHQHERLRPHALGAVLFAVQDNEMRTFPTRRIPVTAVMGLAEVPERRAVVLFGRLVEAGITNDQSHRLLTVEPGYRPGVTPQQSGRKHTPMLPWARSVKHLPGPDTPGSRTMIQTFSTGSRRLAPLPARGPAPGRACAPASVPLQPGRRPCRAQSMQPPDAREGVRRGWGGRLRGFTEPRWREPRRSWPQRRALPGRSTDCPTRRKLTGP